MPLCTSSSAVLALWLASTAAAQQPLQPPAPIAQDSAVVEISSAGTRHVLIICGLSGDAEHHRSYSDVVTQLHEGLIQRLGCAAGHITVLFGDEPDDQDSAMIKSSRRSTREEVAAAAADLCQQARRDDAAWIIVLGHSHFDGRNSWLNLPGPDMTQEDFAACFRPLAAGEQVFFITTPTSGQYIKPLSARGRSVLTATESDWETNDTEFPFELGRVLADPKQAEGLDADRDGQISLLDVYLTVVRHLAQSYVDQDYLSTEHALLDDNGDGRGTELQIDYLTAELGGRVRRPDAPPPVIAAGADGALSKAILLPGLRK